MQVYIKKIFETPFSTENFTLNQISPSESIMIHYLNVEILIITQFIFRFSVFLLI